MILYENVNYRSILHLWKSPEMWGDDDFNMVSSMLYYDGVNHLGGNAMDVYKMHYACPQFFAAKHKGFHAGVVSIFSIPGPTGDQIRFRGLYVKPEYRGQGIAENLLKRAIREANFREADFYWALAGPNSTRVHEKVGFRKITEQAHHLPDGNFSKHKNSYLRYDP